MKQCFIKRFALAALLACSLPATLLAQPDKEKDKTKDKAGRQQIVITRSGDKDEKTVIEIDGDKVKVNGKDVADLKDIQVHVNNLKIPNAMAFRTSPDVHGNFNMTFDDNGTRLFSVDSNRAMLGVVTEGDDRGAAIQSITKESAAEKAGLKKGDVITKIDNRKIDATEDVSDAIRAHKPGDKVNITYLREGKEQKAAAELGRWKGIDMKGMTASPALPGTMWRDNTGARTFERVIPSIQGGMYNSVSRPRLGMAVQDTDDGKGVKVLEVEEEGTASKAGIKKDDVIMQVDEKAVNSADEVAKVMKDKKDQPVVRVQLNRGGKMQTVEVKIPRKLKTVDL
jgi:serine protease Do